MKEALIQPGTSKDDVNDGYEEVSSEEDVEDDNFEVSDSKWKNRINKKKKETVTLEIPRNIVQKLAPTIARYNQSSTGVAALLSKTVTLGGGDISDLPFSRRQVEDDIKSSIQHHSSVVKDDFMEQSKNKHFGVHFDGKQIKDFTDGVKKEKERLPVVVSSPDMEKSQILGAQGLDGQAGNDIAESVIIQLEEFKIKDQVVGLSFDTTATNTGSVQGACTRLEAALGRKLMWLACRRHIQELHVKHVDSKLRPTSGPKDTLFVRFQEAWPDILQSIDYSNLNKFSWEASKNTMLETQAEMALGLLNNFLIQKTFPREDYAELCQLGVMYLGGIVPDFKFQYPGPVHSARYMAKALYMLKMHLLLSQVNIFSNKERQIIAQMSEFIGLFWIV